MNLRNAASVVLVGALAYACSSGPRSDVALERGAVSQQGFALASIGGGGIRSTKAVEKTVKSGSSGLSTTFDVAQDGDEVRFALRVVNATPKSVEVNFPSGQAYDFVVVDSVGREVWRWADGRIFTQSVQNKLLGKGESISVTEKWSSAKPGKFTAVALLRSSNFPIEQKVEFERR
ncbi:MAG TPA: BsuPI-related putative proteinase inhibitor [Gemmatimonadaceae bacterium]|nr:BsuPI-related putative proteinase inhibitor [Gemmatimonadaceae bacterium]